MVYAYFAKYKGRLDSYSPSIFNDHGKAFSGGKYRHDRRQGDSIASVKGTPRGVEIFLETTPDGTSRGHGKASSGGKYSKQGLDVKVTPSHLSRGTSWRCRLHINKE